jgi:flavin-binding protein dodecin
MTAASRQNDKNDGRSHLPWHPTGRIVGKSIDDAIPSAVSRASTLHNLRWFEAVERGAISRTASWSYQVTLKVGFTMED